MTAFGFKIKGLKRLEDQLEAVAVSANKALRDELILGGFAIQRTAKKSIQSPTRGREYKRGSITHIASKPGAAPNTDTGRLVNSIFVDTKTERGKTIVTVGTNVKYGKMLEFGTTNIAARPWMRPAVEKNRNALRRNLVKAANAGLKRGAK